MRPIVTCQVAWPVGRKACHSSEPCKNDWSWTDRDAVLVEDSGGPKEPWGPDLPWEGAILRGKGMPQHARTTLWCELCKNVWTDPVAVLAMDSDGPKEAYIRWGPDPHANWQLLGERTCLSYVRTVCSNHVKFRLQSVLCTQETNKTLWYNSIGIIGW